ncbi:MAG: ImmA/IrrE family metallo-endopeptidase [Rhodobacteraceae bacterium]|nr:ImmA/IrrE family metallo-endopeptidase [Paracoccaceae bacterium]
MTTTFREQLEIIRKHQDSPPVPVVALANDLGLRVFKSGTRAWSDNVSGLIKRTSGDGFEIYVNGDHQFHRRRFTIAHEIAHFVLHKDKIGDELTDDALYRSGLSNEIEREANSFAAKILMPPHLINDKIQDGVNNIYDLATIFKVSPSAMSLRLGVPLPDNS